jgi:hypothetical protein
MNGRSQLKVLRDLKAAEYFDGCLVFEARTEGVLVRLAPVYGRRKRPGIIIPGDNLGHH